ncbi:WD40 repeat domain-containing protein [Microcoleus sp. FACHB-SPT15]|uniref:WD40 repeat domain-containing protein n=1 Tax=Microcoleus sp. FACHB-SPT15 TaxID=2692830 RepID=UPI001783FA06|nr:WD40 repeat domain-containing protein [Microcoleus sp. FACHB-SPT15]MBD1805338.1 WD40 repeat domain-containing protein [Microcoleus sp. FACHB-SPT15]
MEELKAWSFLVSSSQNLEFTTIVAPDFICDAQIPDLLKKAVAKYRYPTDSGQAVYIEIPYRELGNIVLVFRTSWASTKYIGREEDEILKDPQRPIPFIEGMVLKESIRDEVVAAINFEQIHEQLVKHYKDFWELTTIMPATPSKSFNLLKDSEPSRNLILKRETPLTIAQSGIQSRSKSWQCLHTILDTSSQSVGVCSVAFSPDGKQIAIRYYDQTVRIWSRDKEKLDTVWSSWTPKHSVSSVAFSPDGQFIASGMVNLWRSNVIKMRNLRTDKDEEFSSNEQGEISTVVFAFHPSDGKFIVSGSHDKTIKLWVISTRQIQHTFPGGLDRVNSIAISPDIKILVSGDEKGIINLWDFEKGSKIMTIEAHKKAVNSVVFSPKCKIFASSSEDGKINIWDRGTGEKVGSIEVHCPVNSITFSPDSSILASSNSNKGITIWNVETEQQICTLDEHEEKVTSVAFSPDGRLLVSGSKDGTVKVWCRT